MSVMCFRIPRGKTENPVQQLGKVNLQRNYQGKYVIDFSAKMEGYPWRHYNVAVEQNPLKRGVKQVSLTKTTV